MAVMAGGGVARNRFREPARPRASTTGVAAASNARRDAAIARRNTGPSATANRGTVAPRPKAQPAPRRSAPTPRPNSGGQMRSGGGGGGGGGFVPSAPGVEAPGPINDTDWLAGDSTYLSQLANFDKALADFQGNQNLSRSQYETQYGLDKKSLTEAQTKGQGDLKNDFAGRGLLQSGLYNNALSDLNQEFQTQFTQLDTNQKAFLDNLSRELANYQTESTMSRDQAKADALRRRAATMGI